MYNQSRLQKQIDKQQAEFDEKMDILEEKYEKFLADLQDIE